MKKNYKVEVLKNLATINISGVDKKSLDNEISIKLCNYTDVYNSWAITKYKSLFFMNATATQNEIDKFILKKGMVAITKDSEKKDDIGISTYIADDFENVILGYHNALIKPNHDKLNGSFLNAYLHTSFVRKYFSNNASGSGQRFTLSPNRINKLQIYLPSIKTQNYIGKLFSRIDKQIELNNLIYSELEKMAKTLYDYWFVQFDFPDENGRPYKSYGGKMVWSEELQREIPYGWEVKKLKELVLINKNKSQPDYNKFLLDLSVMPSNSFCLQQFSKGDKLSTNIFTMQQFDILFGSIRPYLLKAGFAPTNGLVAGTIHSVKPIDSNLYNYLLLTFCSNSLFNYAIQNSKGSRMPVIGIDDLLNYKIAFNKNIIYKFENSISFKEIIANTIMENQELISLRDFLLPLLMNGQAVIKE